MRHDPCTAIRNPTRVWTSKSAAHATATLLAAGTYLMGLIGCRATIPPPPVSKAPYPGPTLSVFATSKADAQVPGLGGLATYRIQMDAPSPGYTLELDRVDDGFNERTVYITCHRPYQDFPHDPTPVTQILATSATTDLGLIVFARLADALEVPDADAKYHLAARVPKSTSTNSPTN
ncbi:MAG: hypothetical protein AB7Q00_04270 [Phycisphaerales bacterium]